MKRFRKDEKGYIFESAIGKAFCSRVNQNNRSMDTGSSKRAQRMVHSRQTCMDPPPFLLAPWTRLQSIFAVKDVRRPFLSLHISFFFFFFFGQRTSISMHKRCVMEATSKKRKFTYTHTLAQGGNNPGTVLAFICHWDTAKLLS